MSLKTIVLIGVVTSIGLYLYTSKIDESVFNDQHSSQIHINPNNAFNDSAFSTFNT